jgi:hypothetical protein
VQLESASADSEGDTEVTGDVIIVAAVIIIMTIIIIMIIIMFIIIIIINIINNTTTTTTTLSASPLQCKQMGCARSRSLHTCSASGFEVWELGVGV